jgi:hypothetical protein
MTRKIYRTAQGKMVDLGRLQLQNENTRSVGNMKVNARGDRLDSLNRPIQSRNQQVDRQYQRQVTAQTQERVSTSQKSRTKKQAEIPQPPEDFDDNFEKTTEDRSASGSPIESGGLAAAIARARQIKQEPLKTPRDLAKQQPGVRKL